MDSYVRVSSVHKDILVMNLGCTVASQQESSGFESRSFLCGVCMFSPCLLVFPGCSGFLPPSKTCMLGLILVPVPLSKALVKDLELVPGRCTAAAHHS